MGAKEVSARWLKASRALKKEDGSSMARGQRRWSFYLLHITSIIGEIMGLEGSL